MSCSFISDFQNNRIIIFPQTAYYEGDKKDELIRAFSDKINYHNDILLMVRDKASYNLFKDHITESKIQLCPDIVLSMGLEGNTYTDQERTGVGICIREDKESINGKRQRDSICSILERKGYSYRFITTFADHNVYPEERENILNEKWKEFASCRIVITDRLHGMIFSAITGTPCIAFDNLSGKVSGGYEWIKNRDYIVLCKDIDDFDKIADNIELFIKSAETVH